MQEGLHEEVDCDQCNTARIVKFGAQIGFSAVAVGFSCYMLSRDPSSNVYLSLLTMILGVWTPQPKK
jgi:hypothetical protein